MPLTLQKFPKSMATRLLLCSCLLCPSGLRATADENSFATVGYLPQYRIGGMGAKPLKGLTDLIYFSLEPTKDGKFPVEPVPAQTQPVPSALPAPGPSSTLPGLDESPLSYGELPE